MLVGYLFYFLTGVALISAQFMVFCLKHLMKKGKYEESYKQNQPKEEKNEESLHTAEELLSTDETQKSSPRRLVLLPKRTAEQKEFDQKRLRKAKKWQNESSTWDDASWPEEEDTLFGVHSLLTDATSLARSVTARPSISSINARNE